MLALAGFVGAKGCPGLGIVDGVSGIEGGADDGALAVGEVSKRDNKCYVIINEIFHKIN